jgi:copper chaperone CopZ
MKTFMLVLAFALIQLSVFAQSEDAVKTETVEFKVFGNCGMCKSRIEKALNVEGVESVNWDKETKMASVVFNSEKISEDKLHQLVAEVGHDTDKVTAKDETYSKLHGCCKYERPETKTHDKENHESHKH